MNDPSESGQGPRPGSGSEALGRFIEVTRGALDLCESQIEEWNSLKTDYFRLEEQLENLPKKFFHDCQIPFGPQAFMMGRLIHTNELLVLLGENWFVDQSAFEAKKISNRRLKKIEEKLKILKEEKNFLESRLKFAREDEGDEGSVEIREKFDVEKEAEWRKNRQKSKEKIDESENFEIRAKKAPKKISQKDFDAILRRLDELEAEEDAESEENSESEEEEKSVKFLKKIEEIPSILRFL